MPNYTTHATVRTRAGFDYNMNVTTASITAAIAIADSVIDSYISDTYSLPLSETPSIITEIATLYSEGVILGQEYGEESQDTKKEGAIKRNMAISMLNDIKKKKIKLLDSASVELQRVTTNKPSFYPTQASSSLNNADNTAPKFTMNQQF